MFLRIQQWFSEGGPAMALLWFIGLALFFALLSAAQERGEKKQQWDKWIIAMAALAPMVGLLGTVNGMVEVFSSLAGDEGSLAGGIRIALRTTQYGLSLAVSALLGRFALRRFSTEKFHEA